MKLNGIPIEHGMEIEQDGAEVPTDILNDYSGDYLGAWEHDPSGPRELPGVGPSKQVGSLVKKFNHTLRGHDDEMPWEWHNEDSYDNGCGSHAHITFADGEADMDRKVKGMTIAWNTAVELTPFLAPFWCADWEDGFRDSVQRWAAPQMRRKAKSTVRSDIRRNRSRDYNSVTFNPATDAGKPVTIELRLNEGHPSFSMVGLTFLRRTMTKAMRGGWSPKLDGDRRSKLNELYTAIYTCERRGGLVEAMKGVGPFKFKEDRGIPGSNQLEFESAWDVLLKIMAVNGIDRGAYDDHVKKLIQAAGRGDEVTVAERFEDAVPGATMTDGGEWVASGSALGPQNNARAVWHTHDDDFQWDVGPEVDPR